MSQDLAGLTVLWTSGDKEVAKMKEAGIKLESCKACADQYGVSSKLEELGIEVKYMGQPLTDCIKGDWEVVTF